VDAEAELSPPALRHAALRSIRRFALRLRSAPHPTTLLNSMIEPS
jgi:hypothetical protein